MSRVSSAAAFLIPLLVYWWTAAPGMTLIDSGELALSAWDPGVAHPPGFPLYVLVGFLFAHLPFAEPARNLNIFSALCGAAACWLVFTCARLVIRRGRDWTVDLAALSAALVFGFSFVLWGFTSFTEVYTLNLALLAAALFFLLRAMECGTPPPRLLRYAALFWALALTVHLGTVALTAPAFIFAALTAGEERPWSAAPRNWRRLLRPAALAVAVAALLYSTIALLAWLGPQFNWGDPGSLTRFLRHVSGRQYQGNLFSSPAAVVWAELLRIGRHALFQGTPAAFLAALWGIAVLRRRSGRLLTTLLLLAAFNVFYALAYEINEDKEAYYLVTFLAGALLMAAGTADLLQRLRTRPLLSGLTAALLALLPLTVLGLHWEECDRSGDNRAEVLVREICDPLSSGALLLTQEWQFYSPWLYFHHVRGYRPDLRVVDVNLVRRSWYMGYLEQEIPGLISAAGQEKRAFLEQLANFEEDRPYDPGTIQQAFVAFFNGLIAAAGAEGAPVHITIPMENGVGAGLTHLPRGISFQLFPPGSRRPAQADIPILERERWVFGQDDLAGRKIKWLHGEMLYWAGRYLADQGETGRAGRFVERAAAVHPPGTPYPGRLAGE
jgi:hypothetical protein